MNLSALSKLPIRDLQVLEVALRMLAASESQTMTTDRAREMLEVVITAIDVRALRDHFGRKVAP